MIIQSKFHDYYDSLANQYRDEKIVYHRETKSLRVQDIPKKLLEFQYEIFNEIGGGYEKLNCIILCGKVYPYFEKSQNYKITRDFKKPFSHFKAKKTFWGPATIYLPNYHGEGLNLPEAVEANKTIAPVIQIASVWRHTEITTNPNLGETKFHLNPFELYQMLLQFIAPKDPDIIETDTKYKVQAHGMDKTSFRRDKGGPTRKRKNTKT